MLGIGCVKLASGADTDLVCAVIPDLIYDVGAADGADSAYYLHKGFRVVAVEASPDAAAMLRRRFDAEIADGRLALVEAAIADREGEASFWLCPSHPDWSSFDPAIAGRDGSAVREVRVRTTRFDALLREHGLPFYCKIDIEGADRHCLEALRLDLKPPFLSVEMDHREGGLDLERLRALGYTRFKLVSQASRAQPLRTLLRLEARLPRRLKSRLLRLESWLRGRRRDGDWVFSTGSSGPFAYATPGRWRSWEEIYRDWRLLHELARRHPHLGDWFDIHAAQ